jgi:hypothetical protein
MSKYHREGRQHEIAVTDLNRAWADFPRQNAEEAIYDLSVQSGVLQGLSVIPSAVPNLSVKVSIGRGVYRDTVTARGKLIAVNSEQTLDLSGQIPGSGSVTRYITARAKTASPFGSDILITPPGAGSGTPFYDATYTPTAFAPSDGDDCTTANAGLEIRTVAPSGDDRILLATITLTAGQTQIGVNSINNTSRAYAMGLLTEHNANGSHIIQNEIIIGDAGAPAFQTGYEQAAAVGERIGFYKGIDAMVHVFGLLKMNTTVTGQVYTTAFNLPVGYRPKTALYRYMYASAGGPLSTLALLFPVGILPNGDVQIRDPYATGIITADFHFRGY